ncbi:MAG: PLD nuclease N-terminal domain-containing protein [Firmicutes bacterium]|nr:PLD nuclease N-terminal domain-containing protein [Bacillota bacterium]
MTLFIVGLIVFLGSLALTITLLGMWVYKDAQVKSEQDPIVWVLAVLFIPNLIGLIVYFLVGRAKKDVPAPGTYKKALITSAILFVVSIPLFVVGTVSLARFYEMGERSFSAVSVNRGTWMGRSVNIRNNQWTENVRRGNGTSRRTFSLTEEQMRHFHVESTSDEGGLFLLLEQGGMRHEVDISFEFFGTVNLHYHGFEPGRIRMTLVYERVRNSRTLISWRAP